MKDYFAYVFSRLIEGEKDYEKLLPSGNRLFLHIVYKEVDINFAAEQKTVANGK